MANFSSLVSRALFALLFLQRAAAQAPAPAPIPCAEAPRDIWLVAQDFEALVPQTIGVWYANVPAKELQRRVRLVERRKKKKKKKTKSEEKGEEEQQQDPNQGPAAGADCTFTQSSTGGQDTLLFKNTAIYRQIVCVATALNGGEMECYWLNAGDSCTTTSTAQWLFFSAGPKP